MNATVSTENFEPYIGEPNVDRLIRAMRRQEVDRVPNWEALIEDQIVEKILGRFAGNTLAFSGEPAKGVVDGETTIPMKSKDYIELCKIIGHDVLILGNAIFPQYKKADENGKLILVSDKSVKNKSDFKKLKRPGKEDINLVIKYLKEYKEALKDTRIGVTVQIGGFFIYCYEFLVGMNDFMLACYEDRSFINGILEDVTDYLVELSRAVINEGISYSYFFDDGGFKTGLYLPPKLMKEIWVPNFKRLMETAKDADKAVFFHSCGNITDLVEDLIETGVDCVNPMDPSGIDYRDWKKRFGSRICLSGNIDVEFPLVNGTPGDVEKDVKEHMEVLKPGYGYIAASSHSIVNYMPFENFVTMINAIHKYGK
ncbi:MAG: hypothetical protein FJW66_05820, partial [Actinobacteria bacterium]|nr:hypothetical protein [Actinomycetota bacterium]